MNYSMVKTLILKDWHFQRTAILLAFAGGAVSFGIVFTGTPVSYTHLDVYKRQCLTSHKSTVPRFRAFFLARRRES